MHNHHGCGLRIDRAPGKGMSEEPRSTTNSKCFSLVSDLGDVDKFRVSWVKVAVSVRPWCQAVEWISQAAFDE